MTKLSKLTVNDIHDMTEICRLGMRLDEWYEDLVKEKTTGARDYEPELGLIAEVEGEAAGFAQGVVGEVRGELRGFIRLLAVHPKWRGLGVGRELLLEMEKRLIARNVKAISIMDVPANYYMPGVDVRYKEAFCFLEKHGYKRGAPNINLICDVRPGMFDCREDINRAKKQGFEIRRAVKSDWDGVEKFLKTNWACWIEEARSSFLNDPITMFICIHENEVVGFCGYEGNNRGLGWFGPMGVSPVTRGKGVGAIVCKLCLEEIARLGHEKAIIPWVGPVRFYDKVCNADMDRTFWTFLKKIDS